MPPCDYTRGFELSGSIRHDCRHAHAYRAGCQPRLFIARWTAGEGGQERANYAPFLSELCDALEVRRPDPASHDTELNAYVFERAVIFREPDGSPRADASTFISAAPLSLRRSRAAGRGNRKSCKAASLIPSPKRPPRSAGAPPRAHGMFSC